MSNHEPLPILNLIRRICENGESGRLEILAGAIQGELSFRDGKLVDARVGHLKGFQAVNAVAAMQNARASFDSAFEILASSSISASERVVLKQFFGIETEKAYLEPAVSSWPEEAAQILNPEPVSEAADEVTIVRSDDSARSTTVPNYLPHTPRISFRTALVFAALVIAIMGGAVFVINRFREHSAPAVATVVETPSHPVVEPVVAQKLSGKWNVVNTVQSTSYHSYKNLKIGFDLSIDQNGTSFTGKGRKVSENGRTLPVNNRTPIQVKGSINGDTIEATFFEDGAVRKTNGRFVWRIDKAGRGMNGTFATTAARSSGKSAATKEM
jgi:hypothetical protein